MKNEQEEIHGTAVQVDREEAERGSTAPDSIPGEAAVEDDGTPVLDEQDLEENDLSEEEAENVEWEPESDAGGGTAGQP